MLLVLAGPSGVGKGTIGQALLAREPELTWSVSATTRAPRPGERDGVDYHFISRDDFERVRDADGFVESFEVYGQLKGTPRASIEGLLAAGADVLIEIDVQGALAVKARYPDACLVFIRAPSRAIQSDRLRSRGSEDAEQLRRRLDTAAREEDLSRHFDAVVTNDDLDQAVGEVAAILSARRAGHHPDGSS